MAFIRQYKESDFDAMSHICRATLPPSLSASAPATRLAPYVWTHQYTLLSPSTCFVVDDGTGRAVGYCIGCPDIPTFCDAYPRYVAEVLEGRGTANGDIQLHLTGADDLRGERAPWIDPATGLAGELALSQLAYSAQWLLVDGSEDLLREGYRATMHIDILDEFQGQGWGRRLLEALVEGLLKVDKTQARREDGSRVVKGIWLGVGGDNSHVVPFYEKLGFRVKQREVKTTTIVMVRDY